MHLPFSSSVFSFCKILLAYSLLGIRKSTGGKIGASLRPGTRPAGRRCRPRKGEEEIGMGVPPVPWPVMRHQVRVKESTGPKVAEERNLKCSRGTSTLLRMISRVSETSCLGRRAVWARRTRQIEKLMTRSTN